MPERSRSWRLWLSTLSGWAIGHSVRFRMRLLHARGQAAQGTVLDRASDGGMTTLLENLAPPERAPRELQ
jgi:hypothetical protein